jgi:ABC-type phosphate/phosphonate transport system permease subunit
MNNISKKILKVVFIILAGFPSSIFFYVKIEELIILDKGGYGNYYRYPKFCWLFDYFFNLKNYQYTPNTLFTIIMFFIGFCFATILMYALNKLFKVIK